MDFLTNGFATSYGLSSRSSERPSDSKFRYLMRGLDPAIQALSRPSQDVDHQDKPRAARSWRIATASALGPADRLCPLPAPCTDFLIAGLARQSIGSRREQEHTMESVSQNRARRELKLAFPHI